MTDVLPRDADALHRALDAAGDEVEVSVSRETAEWLARIVDARSRGQQIVRHARARRGHSRRGRGAARRLTPQVRKFMDEGKLGFRMVGAHHRIPLESIEAFRLWEREQMTTGMEELSRLQNELGLVE